MPRSASESEVALLLSPCTSLLCQLKVPALPAGTACCLYAAKPSLCN